VDIDTLGKCCRGSDNHSQLEQLTSIMPVVVFPAIAAHIAEIDVAMVPLDEGGFSVELDVLVTDRNSPDS
jgi:hypothetical protein